MNVKFSNSHFFLYFALHDSILSKSCILQSRSIDGDGSSNFNTNRIFSKLYSFPHIWFWKHVWLIFFDFIFLVNFLFNLLNIKLQWISIWHSYKISKYLWLISKSGEKLQKKSDQIVEMCYKLSSFLSMPAVIIPLLGFAHWFQLQYQCDTHSR